MIRLISALVFAAFIAFPAPGVYAAENVASILKSKKLEKSYNPVLIDFLLEEGVGKLKKETRKTALTQLVAALRAKVKAAKDEQATVAMGNAIGLAMSMSGDKTVRSAGRDVSRSYNREWVSWVDAAFKLLRAGYKKDAIEFFTFGLSNIPDSYSQSRCVQGLAQAKPDEAFGLLMKWADEPDEVIRNPAMRNLGHLAAWKKTPKKQKEAILDKLLTTLDSMTTEGTDYAVIYALDLIKDPKAVEPLKAFTERLTASKETKRAAIRSLLLTFKDKSVVEELQKLTKSGFMTMNDDEDNLFGGTLLIAGGEEAGYAWAKEQLTPKKKSLLSLDKDKADFTPDVVTALVNKGGEKSREILAETIGNFKDDEWIKTWMATGLLILGDKSQIGFIKESLKTPNWSYTAVRITEALAKYKDYSGISALKQLAEKRPPEKSGAQKLLGMLAGKKDQSKAQARKLANLRIQIAGTLGDLNHKDGVPILITLLSDENYYVRSSAAYALSRMKTATAVNGLAEALNVDYGNVRGKSRNPQIHAHIIRMAALRFGKSKTSKSIVKNGLESPFTSVRFISAANN